MNKNLLVGLSVIVLIVAALGYFFFQQNKDLGDTNEQKKTPHFLDSTPLHDDVYAAQPINVTINFDFDLVEGSKISVTSTDGTDWANGKVKIEDNKTALKKDLKQGMPDGDYKVAYTACWPDGSCHDGFFWFKIDSSKKVEYQDLRNTKEVTVDMKEISFVQEKIIISSGTKVTWVNADTVEHFVNTQTHPEHTYFPPQNSRSLGEGVTFSTIFEIPGQYDYHCSTHADQMHGSIIVSN